MEGSPKRVQLAEKNCPSPESQRINQLLWEYEKNFSLDLIHRMKHQQKQHHAKSSHLLQNGMRKWLFQKGKGYLVDFDQHQRRKLKDFFNTLDKKKCGSIGIDELQEMLLGLGLANGIQQVKNLIGNVDQDHSGKIEFEQFIQMIQDDSKQNEVVVNFFKQLIFSQIPEKSRQKQSLLTKLNFSKTVKPTQSQKEIFKNKTPFEMVVSQIRRNHILSSMDIGRCKSNGGFKDLDRVNKGKEVVKALQKMDERRLMRKIRENTALANQQTSNKNMQRK